MIKLPFYIFISSQRKFNIWLAEKIDEEFRSCCKRKKENKWGSRGASGPAGGAAQNWSGFVSAAVMSSSWTFSSQVLDCPGGPVQSAEINRCQTAEPVPNRKSRGKFWNRSGRFQNFLLFVLIMRQQQVPVQVMCRVIPETVRSRFRQNSNLKLIKIVSGCKRNNSEKVCLKSDIIFNY